MTEWTVTVVDTVKVKGKPMNWMPSATMLLAVGVPLKVARRYARVRREMTAGLKRRVKADRN